MRCRLCLGRSTTRCPLCHDTGNYLSHGYVESNERYTPSLILESARIVMGSIDFDPASSEIANRRVKATEFYTHKENGLKQYWHGNVWCNPPYGRVASSNVGLQSLFIQRGLVAYHSGDVAQIMFLLNGNSPYRDWFRLLHPYPMCMYIGDVHFWTPQGVDYDNGYGTVIVYVGTNKYKFAEEFNQHGLITQSIYSQTYDSIGNRLPGGTL